MRSSDRLMAPHPKGLPARALAALVAGALATVLAGCGALPGRAPTAAASTAPADKDNPPAAASAPVAATPAAAPAAVAETPAAPVRPVALTPATQQAYDQALAALRGGRHAEAEAQLRALAKALPSLGGVQANLGLALRHTGKKAESLAALQRAAELAPANAQIHNELGIALRLQGQFAAARQAYERALALRPDLATAHLNLAILLDLYQGDGLAALPHYERYQALAGSDTTVAKWVQDLKNRKPVTTTAMKDKP